MAGWNGLPKGLHTSLPLEPSPRGHKLEWQKVELNPVDEEIKLTAIRAYKSQLRAMSHFIFAFVRTNELFISDVKKK